MEPAVADCDAYGCAEDKCEACMSIYGCVWFMSKSGAVANICVYRFKVRGDGSVRTGVETQFLERVDDDDGQDFSMRARCRARERSGCAHRMDTTVLGVVYGEGEAR